MRWAAVAGVAVLLAQALNGEPRPGCYESDAWACAMDRCTATLLAEWARSGGLRLDPQHGMGEAADRAIAECRRQLGEAWEP